MSEEENFAVALALPSHILEFFTRIAELSQGLTTFGIVTSTDQPQTENGVHRSLTAMAFVAENAAQLAVSKPII